MKKTLVLMVLCFLMLGLFPIVLVSGHVEHHPLPSVHAVMGMLLVSGVGVHLLLHTAWIKANFSVIQRGRLPGKRALQNFSLLASWLAVAASGLWAGVLPGHPAAECHLICAVSLAVLQALHLYQRRRWLLGRLASFQM
jgi:hypothetical protein